MKPLHVGLLIVGAALAGGLAVKMTQPQPIVTAYVPAPATPAPVSSPPVKAAPKTPPPGVVSRRVETFEAAPPPVWIEPPKPTPVLRTTLAPKPDVRKNKPILMAKTLPQFRPPTPYVGPADPPREKAPDPPVVVEAAPPPALPPPVRQVTLFTGMTIQVRLIESLSSERSVPGDTFDAVLADPLVVDGLVIAERGARVHGRIVEAQRAGWFTGAGLLELELSNLLTSDGQKVSISSDPWATRGKPVNVPSETVIRFRLASRVTIKERQL
jgi:hypothetical protein